MISINLPSISKQAKNGITSVAKMQNTKIKVLYFDIEPFIDRANRIRRKELEDKKNNKKGGKT